MGYRDGPDVQALLLSIFVPLIFFTLLFYFLCRQCCKGRCLACRATSLPEEEAQEIINAMQGDWDVTLTPGSCMCGATSFERMTVTGSMYARIHSAGGTNRAVHLKPARSTDGDLILDAHGSKAIVFTPEEGRMEIELMGWKCEWKRVQGQQVVSSGSSGIADEVQKLGELRQQGLLSEEEFSAAKNRLIYPDQSSGGPSSSYDQPPPYPADLEAGLPLKTY